jgi:hypothetical protein
LNKFTSLLAFQQGILPWKSTNSREKRLILFSRPISRTVVKKMKMKLGISLLAIVAVLAVVCPVKALVGDVNGDGKVDMKDIGVVAKAFGSYGPDYLYPGSPPTQGWNPAADLNSDGKIDMIDVAIVASNFGK